MRAAAGLLLPLAPLWAGAVRLRRTAYRRGWLERHRLPVPVVSVGNLTFGGTGKTPLVIALVRDLVRRGRRPAVLTRGYGRRGREPEVLVGPGPLPPASAVGDEPLEMALRLPGVPVVVDADRRRGGGEAVRRGSDVLVLDDGFQHLRLARDLDLVAVDAGDPWGGGRMPPLGRLREPLDGLERADAVVVTKLPAEPRPVLDRIGAEVRRRAPGLPVVGARLTVRRVLGPDGEGGPELLAGRRVLPFAGVGRPGGFADLLRAAGAELAGERWFPDHHAYREGELRALLEEAARLGAVAVTTAKDAVKLPPDLGAWVVEAELVPLDGEWGPLWALLPEV